MVSLFLCNREAYILLGGELTKNNSVGTRIPLRRCGFAICFYIGCWVVVNSINNAKINEGIIYAQKGFRSETFAEDTSICIKRNPEYLRKCLEFLKHLARISGLQCNMKQTAVIPIGGIYDINDKWSPKLAFSWENKITLLGFQIDNRLK